MGKTGLSTRPNLVVDLSESNGVKGRNPAGGGPANLLKVGAQVNELTRFCSAAVLVASPWGGSRPHPIAVATSSAGADRGIVKVILLMTAPLLCNRTRTRSGEMPC